MSRKDIYDNLPPGTYPKTYSLKDALDNISYRLNALEKKNRVCRAGTDEGGIILWTVPRDETGKTDTEEKPNPLDGWIGRRNLTADIMRHNPPPSIPVDIDPADPVADETCAGLPEMDFSPDNSSADLLAAVDRAFGLIRAAIAEALDKPAPIHIVAKAHTLAALDIAIKMLEHVSPGHAAVLSRLGDVVEAMEEAR
jgi:hypothetical protein